VFYLRLLGGVLLSGLTSGICGLETVTDGGSAHGAHGGGHHSHLVQEGFSLHLIIII